MNAKTDMKILLCSTGPGAGARYGPGAEAGYGSGERTGYGPWAGAGYGPGAGAGYSPGAGAIYGPGAVARYDPGAGARYGLCDINLSKQILEREKFFWWGGRGAILGSMKRKEYKNVFSGDWLYSLWGFK